MTNELQQIFIKAFPELDIKGQQQAMQLYRLLANGSAVSVEKLAKSIALSTKETEQLLLSWTGVTFNENKMINGFWGVSTEKTTHRFQLDQGTLYTWCAWDLLFMPHIFHQTIQAETLCPITNQIIKLSISGNGIETVSPEHAMITFIKPDLEALKANVTNSFCQYIFFVASENAGKEWQSKQKDGFLINMDQGFELGKNIIQQVFRNI